MLTCVNDGKSSRGSSTSSRSQACWPSGSTASQISFRQCSLGQAWAMAQVVAADIDAPDSFSEVNHLLVALP